MDRYFIETDKWEGFISKLLDENDVYAPVESEKDLYFKKIDKQDIPNIVWDRCRTVEPAKGFVNPFLEEVVSARKADIRKLVVLGLRNCDLLGFELLDKIFADPELLDPFYNARRQKVLFIASDCIEPRPTCHCVVWGINAFPEKNFDLSVAQIRGGFVLEVPSQIGRNVIIKGDLVTSTLVEDHLSERQGPRNRILEKLKGNNKEYHLFAGDNISKEVRINLIKGKENSPVWDEHSRNCVTCGACTQVCPTCHCFLLAELKSGDFEKNKYWDSCQFTGYGRVAGGANPRSKIAERLANRYFCKLENRPSMFDGVYGCTGCGRCIEACQGKIDIRKVLKDIKKSS